MSNQVTFKCYGSLSAAMRRNKIISYGATATLLLECFVCNSGELRAAMLEAKGLCEPGKFKVWRDEMIAKGWLNYTIGEYSRHTPGAKLLKYINKEKMVSQEIATVIDVDQKISKSREDLATKEELEKVKEEVLLLKKTVENLVKTYEPPFTDEKIKRHLELARCDLKTQI